MRALLGMTVVVALAYASQPAAAYDYPWCAHYSGRGDSTNCGFVSLEQCRWTVSGIGGFCAQNPFWVAAQAERPSKKKRTHVRP